MSVRRLIRDQPDLRSLAQLAKPNSVLEKEGVSLDILLLPRGPPGTERTPARLLSDSFAVISNSMPSLDDDEHLHRAQDLCIGDSQNWTSRVLEMVFYLLSNKMLSKSRDFDRRLVAYIQSSGFMLPFMKALLASTQPTSRAIAEEIIRAVVQSANMEAVETLVHVGVSVQKIIDIGRRVLAQNGIAPSFPPSPWQSAVETSNPDLLKLLLNIPGTWSLTHEISTAVRALGSGEQNTSPLMAMIRMMLQISTYESHMEPLWLDALDDAVRCSAAAANLILDKLAFSCDNLSRLGKLSLLNSSICLGRRSVTKRLLALDVARFEINRAWGCRLCILLSAVYSGDRDLCRVLIERRGTWHFEDKTGPRVWTAHVDICANRRREPQRCTSVTFLEYAAYKGDVVLVQLILDEGGADINAGLQEIRELMPCCGAASLFRSRGRRASNVFPPAMREDLKKLNTGGTALEAAILGRHIDMVHLLLNKGAELSGRELMIAVMQKVPELVSLFREYRTGPVAAAWWESVKVAAATEQVQLAREIWMAAAPTDNIGSESKRRSDLARAALHMGHISIAVDLIEEGYDASMLCLAAHTAVAGRLLSPVKAVLSRRDPSHNSHGDILEGCALAISIAANYRELFDLLVSSGILPSQAITFEFHTSPSQAKTLGFHLDPYSKYALHATRHSWPRKAGWWCVTSLLSCQAAAQPQTIGVLEMAISACMWTPSIEFMVLRLLDLGYLASSRAFCWAITAGLVQVVERLLGLDNDNQSAPRIVLDHGIFTINGSNKSRDRVNAGMALSVCIQQNNLELAQVLLRAGVEPNSNPTRSWYVTNTQSFELPSLDFVELIPTTPLQAAALVANTYLLETLLSHGANVNEPAHFEGCTALQAAIRGGHMNAVRMLLAAGADCNARGGDQPDLHGKTALEIAAERGHLDITHLLLASGVQTEGEGCEQYMRAIRLALNQKHVVVAKHIAANRDWTSHDLNVWQRMDTAARIHPYVWARVDWEQQNMKGEEDQLVQLGVRFVGAEDDTSLVEAPKKDLVARLWEVFEADCQAEQDDDTSVEDWWSEFVNYPVD